MLVFRILSAHTEILSCMSTCSSDYKLLYVQAIKIAQGVVSFKMLFIYIQIYTFYNVY
jgi:hypothetical protein